MKKNLTFSFFLSCVIIFLFIIAPIRSLANETDKEIDLATNPVSELFAISNFAPGDWATRELTIQNTGTQDFYYITNMRFITGSKKFFRQLELRVMKEEQLLFEGKLSDFKGFAKRSLSSSTEEKLTFKIDFPRESGNEYQGLAVKFAIEISAEGDMNAVPGSTLPDTATNSFNILFIGVSLLALGLMLYLGRRKLFNRK